VIETTVVTPPPGAIHTGRPVTPERPEPVVVGVIPESWTGPEMTTVLRIVTRVPTVDTVTNDTVPATLTVLETLIVPVATAVTVPVATTIRPVAVAVRPLLAVVNESWLTEIRPVLIETAPEIPIG